MTITLKFWGEVPDQSISHNEYIDISKLPSSGYARGMAIRAIREDLRDLKHKDFRAHYKMPKAEIKKELNKFLMNG